MEDNHMKNELSKKNERKITYAAVLIFIFISIAQIINIILNCQNYSKNYFNSFTLYAPVDWLYIYTGKKIEPSFNFNPLALVLNILLYRFLISKLTMLIKLIKQKLFKV